MTEETRRYYVSIKFEVIAKDRRKALEKAESQIVDKAVYHINNVTEK